MGSGDLFLLLLLLLLLLCLSALSTGNGFGYSTRTRHNQTGDGAPATVNPPPSKHHVFISHRGPDGRRKFTDHLDSALRRRKRIKVFRDDVDLRRGENITQAISRAIEESMLSIVVLSRGYASSEYCLDELVEIMQCRKEKGHQTFPVFYKVSPDDDISDPSSSGMYKDDLDRHKRMHSYERVNSWIKALESISQISGWIIDDHTPEAEMVEKIAEEILWKVNQMHDDDEEEEDEDHHHGVVRMGVANGTRSIRWGKAVVYDHMKKTEDSSDDEAPQPPAENDVVTTSTPNIQLIGVRPVLEYSNATELMYIIASVEIIIKLGVNEEEQVTTIDVVVLDDEEGGGSSQSSGPMGTLRSMATTITKKKKKESSGIKKKKSSANQ